MVRRAVQHYHQHCDIIALGHQVNNRQLHSAGAVAEGSTVQGNIRATAEYACE